MYRNRNPIAAGFPVSPDSIKSLSISPRDLDDQTENLCRGLRPWQRRKRRLVTPALAQAHSAEHGTRSVLWQTGTPRVDWRRGLEFLCGESDQSWNRLQWVARSDTCGICRR